MIERVYLKNLRRRPDRLVTFWRMFYTILDWPLPRPRIFHGIDGRKTSVPSKFKIGPPPNYPYSQGCYGNLLTDIFIFTLCLTEDTKSILILEDDIWIPPEVGKRLKTFFSHLPSDWDIVYLGGVHKDPPIPINEEVVKCKAVVGTYSVAFTERAMQIYQQIAFGDKVSNDMLLVKLVSEGVLKAYAPKTWIVQHRGGLSETSGQVQAGDEWNPPVVFLHCNKQVYEELSRWGWQTGNLYSLLTSVSSEEEKKNKLKEWLVLHWDVCKCKGHIPTVWPSNLVEPKWVQETGKLTLHLEVPSANLIDEIVSSPLTWACSSVVRAGDS